MYIFTVQTLTQAVKDILEGEFPFVWVRGQISNLSRPVSGHFYFSLKDDDAVLSVVWFKGAQPRQEEGERINPLTGEVESGPALTLEDGLDVLVAGRMNVYPPRGVYQLVAELVQTQGQGELAIAFEALKARLASQGYFAADRKMSVPGNPRRVAVITAPQGAALQDFLRIAAHRGFGAEIRVYPSLVQGDAAPAQIAAALDQVDDDAWAEVVVLIRGGGSIEDLWAFNTEIVADALYRARIPVVTGIGHEVDTTIADFVADLRAATPSHAAQMLWTEREVLQQRVDEFVLALHRSADRFVSTQALQSAAVHQQLVWHSPARRIDGACTELERLNLQIHHARTRFVHTHFQIVEQLTRRLYQAFGPFIVADLSAALERADTALRWAGLRFIQTQEHAVDRVSTALTALDPDAPLARGYALVRDEHGQFVCSCTKVAPGQRLCVRVGDGEFAVEVVP